MITYYIVMGVCLLLASNIERQTWGCQTALEGMRYNGVVRLQYYLIVILLIWFSGLRIGFNDTWTYVENFNVFVRAGEIDWSSFSLTNYGGFELYQQLLKTYVSPNAQSLIFVTAVLTTCMYMHYIVKHSGTMLGTFYLFLLGVFVFSMGGMKQSIAIAFGLYAIDGFMERRYLKALLLFLIGFSFHPYIICFAAVILLRDRVWNAKTLLVIVGSVLVIANLESILGLISEIGRDYSVESFTDATINPMRVLVEAMPVVISFFYREQINDVDDPMLTLGTNMNIIGFVFIALGLFFNPMYMGRIATYFTALSMISVPMMLNVAFGGKGKNGRLVIVGYYLFMGAYFLLDLTKLGSVSLLQDQFYRLSFSSFLARMMQ